MTELDQEVLKQTKAEKIIRTEAIQSLWSGYGQIKKYFLEGGTHPSIIVKHIEWPDKQHHPKGWNSEISHQRKLKSYLVESKWYQHFAQRTNEPCRVAQIIHTIEKENEILLMMEDLDASGFDLRLQPTSVTISDAKNGLEWLAHFHARFMEASPRGLWPIGCYWHLDTRPEEWEKMGNIDLKLAARAIDDRLKKAKFQTLVHGDAKLANFCFKKTGEIAAVDFQYVGKGCGMKDVAYFLSSCFEDKVCEKYEKELLSHYFEKLEIALDNSTDFQGIKEEWSNLYKYAWADFYRFLDGWSPGHWKMHRYSKRLTNAAIEDLNI